MRVCMFMRSEARWSSVCMAGEGSQRMESMSPAWWGPEVDEQPARMSGAAASVIMVLIRRDDLLVDDVLFMGILGWVWLVCLLLGHA